MVQAKDRSRAGRSVFVPAPASPATVPPRSTVATSAGGAAASSQSARPAPTPENTYELLLTCRHAQWTGARDIVGRMLRALPPGCAYILTDAIEAAVSRWLMAGFRFVLQKKEESADKIVAAALRPGAKSPPRTPRDVVAAAQLNARNRAALNDAEPDVLAHLMALVCFANSKEQPDAITRARRTHAAAQELFDGLNGREIMSLARAAYMKPQRHLIAPMLFEVPAGASSPSESLHAIERVGEMYRKPRGMRIELRDKRQLVLSDRAVREACGSWLADFGREVPNQQSYRNQMVEKINKAADLGRAYVYFEGDDITRNFALLVGATPPPR